MHSFTRGLPFLTRRGETAPLFRKYRWYLVCRLFHGALLLWSHREQPTQTAGPQPTEETASFAPLCGSSLKLRDSRRCPVLGWLP